MNHNLGPKRTHNLPSILLLVPAFNQLDFRCSIKATIMHQIQSDKHAPSRMYAHVFEDTHRRAAANNYRHMLSKRSSLTRDKAATHVWPIRSSYHPIHTSKHILPWPSPEAKPVTPFEPSKLDINAEASQCSSSGQTVDETINPLMPEASCSMTYQICSPLPSNNQLYSVTDSDNDEPRTNLPDSYSSLNVNKKLSASFIRTRVPRCGSGRDLSCEYHILDVPGSNSCLSRPIFRLLVKQLTVFGRNDEFVHLRAVISLHDRTHFVDIFFNVTSDSLLASSRSITSNLKMMLPKRALDELFDSLSKFMFTFITRHLTLLCLTSQQEISGLLC